MEKRGSSKQYFIIALIAVILIGILYYFFIRIETKTIYNVYLPDNKFDLFTTNTAEKETLLLFDNQDKGIVGCIPSAKSSDTTELFRIYNQNSPVRERVYTTDQQEVDALVNQGWIQEESLGFIYISPGKETIPFLEFKKENKKVYTFTDAENLMNKKIIGYIYSSESSYCK